MEEHTLSRPRTTHLPQALGWGSGGGGGDEARGVTVPDAQQGRRPERQRQAREAVPQATQPMPGAAEGPARRPRHCSAPDTGKDQAATPGKAWVGRRGQRP